MFAPLSSTSKAFHRKLKTIKGSHRSAALAMRVANSFSWNTAGGGDTEPFLTIPGCSTWVRDNGRSSGLPVERKGTQQELALEKEAGSRGLSYCLDFISKDIRGTHHVTVL